MRRRGSGDAANRTETRKLHSPRSSEETFRGPITEDTLSRSGSYLYAAPPGLPDLTGLRYLHAGWWLGELKGGERGRERFEPSHALALAARPLPARRVARFSAGEPALAAYLGGETVTSAGEDGWTLACVDGYGIGWAKRRRGTIEKSLP